MMKKLFLLAFSLGMISLQAQDIITRSDLAYQEGDRHSFSTTNALELEMGLTPETAGPNVSWDLSTISVEILEGKTSVYVDPATTPFAGQVEGANMAIKNENEMDGPYQFVNLSDEGLDHYYTGWYEGGITGFSSFTPPLKALEFPMSYGQTFEQDWVAEMYQEGVLVMIDSTSTSVEVDAWGTVITPAGTFTDVLRMKRISLSSGYMYYGGKWIHTADLSSVDYTWFKAGIHTSLINVSGFLDEEGYTVVWLTNPNVTSVEESVLKPEIRVWPNPAAELLNVEARSIEGLNFYDITGRLIREVEGHGVDILSFSTTAFPRGSYVMEVQSGGARQRKIVVLH